MGYIRKDSNMNVYKTNNNNVHLKQGYLHIKRERSSGPVASRVLFKVRNLLSHVFYKIYTS